ncbi:MAG: hypothetical protein JWL70_1687 [Acidimicrobiia bacterium]|nr:hypothetical protein [Acidimicrobiia bacterium]
MSQYRDEQHRRHGVHTSPVISNAAVVLVLAFVGRRLVQGIFASRSRRARVSEIVRGIRWRHLWPVPFVVTAVVLTAVLLVQVPGLSWGWWQALGGQGNPVFGQSDATAGSAWDWIIPLLFLSLLIPALPLFAEAEEIRFRYQAEIWSTRRRIAMCLAFGLVHALIGIPIGVALALSIGGAYFMNRYLAAGGGAAGLLESTRAHTAYNAVIVSLVLVVVVVDAATGSGLS